MRPGDSVLGQTESLSTGYDAGVVGAQWVLWVAAGLTAGCVTRERPATIWPPEDFSLVVDEVRQDGDVMHVLRRVRFDDRGVVLYGTSTSPLVEEASGASLPVFDRLCIYQLEPTSVRALARSLERLEIADWVPPDRAGDGPLGLSIAWRGFGRQNTLVAAGAPRGRLAEILALVASYLPAGEAFDAALSRPVVPVLRGVPAPRQDAVGALGALRDQLSARPRDREMLLSAYALACRVGDRAGAERLLSRWVAAGREDGAGGSGAFRDRDEVPLAARADVLRRLLPEAR